MNADIVYQVVNALPMEERMLLFDKLKKDFLVNTNVKRTSKVLKKKEAIEYLLKNVFSRNKPRK